MTDSEQEALLPCPFCGGEAKIDISGTQADIACEDCNATNSIQISDYFNDEERFHNPEFAFSMTDPIGYGEAGIKRANKILTELWNTRAKADSAPKLGKGVWLCTNCDNTESKEREVCCWKCSKGEMVYHSFDELRNSAPKLTEEVIKAAARAIGTTFIKDGVWNIEEGWKFEAAAKAALKEAGMEFRGDGK